MDAPAGAFDQAVGQGIGRKVGIRGAGGEGEQGALSHGLGRDGGENRARLTSLTVTMTGWFVGQSFRRSTRTVKLISFPGLGLRWVSK